MLKKFDVQNARETILKRLPLDDMPVSEKTLSGIRDIFKEDLSPSQAVSRILADVRSRGDSALFEWTNILDGVKNHDLAATPEEIKKAMDHLAHDVRQSIELAIERVKKFH